MAWSSVLDQERVVQTLRRALTQERVAHAYLLHGPDGVGKRAVAYEMARALQCPEQADEACDACPTCRKTRRMVHPDVHVNLPHPWSQEKDRDEEDMGKRIRRLGDNPYAAIDYVRRPSLADPSETSNQQVYYRIDQVRQDIIQPMSLARGEGAYKVNVLIDAEKMREEAANTFLKLLEEPPPQTVFLLTTNRPEQLLPTILSRCQQLRFDPLLPETIEQALVDRENMAPDEASMLSRMADGSYSRALELAENDALMTSRELVLDYFRAAYTQKVESLDSCIQELKSQGRERVKSVLRLMLRWMRDLLLYRTMGEEAPLVNVDQKEAVARFCNNLPDADLEGMVTLVEEAMELAERNVRVALVLTALAQGLARAMRGQEVESLYVPLSEAERLAPA
ncbi:DNA polymerase-3 subunit delta' [Salinibacter ruber]|jgi:DNA polymerase-3 subunit delta'|uniref:DNA polymerase III, delta' subunit n=3 Tax=Salinibacter ruber TaxID=146919 RepID=Q2S490_SALRD|nr:DNA polymerase III subunit delta' [Salinibacter ruber]ABC45426.1 putative DNA polymerase III, delta' subunit [Salinibacter ruber DSM 13855]MCS3628579.1 DNA polymerase-3 subunit delta' [Salinibacter ruber]MCS3631384.1 DNA polymerase-3 subunit delta' [Salinibacter ruber]MCS3635451.1 DNA polymerase-3 subunit delta' [Salinibacter ruber]MCS3643561.1 DNA polymerase-3 subunit delta' [Salinibacter ruber]